MIFFSIEILILLLIVNFSKFQVYSESLKGKVHIFYYLWYGTPALDGKYLHWDHEVLPHWQDHVNAGFENIGTHHEPPEQIHSTFYPLKGPYSSQDPEVIQSHFSEMLQAGADVAVVSWWGQANKNYTTDTQGVSTDSIMSHLFELADEIGMIKLAFHLEPYRGRNIESIREDLEYIQSKYGHFKSFYRTDLGMPLYYVYDSYHIPPDQWSRLLQPDGDITIRNTPLDGVFIGLWLERKDGRELKMSGFDGIYTYFASDGFSFGSTRYNWHDITSYCAANNLISVLSVGPGYDDTRIRPWNAHNTHDRDGGKYFQFMWEDAVAAQPNIIRYGPAVTPIEISCPPFTIDYMNTFHVLLVLTISPSSPSHFPLTD